MDEVKRLYRQVGEEDDLDDLLSLLDLAEPTELVQSFRSSIHEGNTNPMYYLAVVLTCADPPEVERLLRQIVDHDPGNVKAILHLGWLLAEYGGDPAEVERLNARAVATGDGAAFHDFAMILVAHGRADSASHYLLTAVAFGESPAARRVELMYRKAIDHGDTRAYNSLAILLAERGDFDEAEELFRAVDVGDVRAPGNLATMLRERDRPG